MIEMSICAFRAFSDPGFHFCFQFCTSVELNKVSEKSQRPYPQLVFQFIWVFFGQFMRNKLFLS